MGDRLQSHTLRTEGKGSVYKAKDTFVSCCLLDHQQFML